MKKVFREYEALCRAEGYPLLAIEVSGRHCRLRFDAGFIVAAMTPSDHRNIQNIRSAIRRLHR
ncbi:hypothetical protein [Rubellimicrobium arenae]|uniref:hypothetical protein n=1 Tax=Rubellimicrobium arenae TaxID=2817372 RepID=UPI001B318074|nr:hypothetical protein [Rubellimicrobium arenae]